MYEKSTPSQKTFDDGRNFSVFSGPIRKKERKIRKKERQKDKYERKTEKYMDAILRTFLTP